MVVSLLYTGSSEKLFTNQIHDDTLLLEAQYFQLHVITADV